MSLDLWMESPGCPTCNHVWHSDDFNHTYNCARMWYEIFPGDNGMVFIDGMTGRESLNKLSKVIRSLRSDADKFSKMNPENGWGSYKSFLSFLVDLEDIASKNPEAIWKSCR